MRVVSYRDDILFGIANELDLDVGSPDWDNAHARKFANSATKWTRIGWRLWNWPELTITEERALREIYSEDRPFTIGTEVYKIDSSSYLRALENVAAGAFDAAQWESIDSPDPYLAYDQPGKQFMGEILSVNATDPRLSASAGAGWQFYPESRGIRLAVSARPTVWVTYRTRPSRFTSDYHDPARAYLKDQLAYSNEIGECYRAAVDIAPGVAITNSGWVQQPMPFILAEYVRMQSAADASEDAIEKADFRAQAAEALTREIDILSEQGARRGKYRLFPRRDSRAMGGNGSALSIPVTLIEVT